MRIKFGLIATLALSIMLVACNEGQAPKIGVVDLNRLMRDSVLGKAGLKFIESQQTELQAQLDAIQDRLEKNPADEAAMQELQKVYSASQQRMQAEGQNVVGLLFDSIQKELNTYREKNGYLLLIRAEAVDSYDPSLDVTNAIMGEVDKLKLEFKPVSQQPGQDTPAEAQAEEAVPTEKPTEKPKEAPKN